MKRLQNISNKFIGFLVVSIFIWMLITLSKEYVASITYPVLYGKLPQDKLLQTIPKSDIEIMVKATGFQIIRSKFKDQPILLHLKNLEKKTATKHYFLLKNQKTNIQKQLLSGMKIESIVQDTMYLELGSLTSKKIPVKPNLDLRYHVGYDASGIVKIDPDSILISGPKTQVENIEFINLKILKIEDVKSGFSEKVAIIKPQNSENIMFNTDFVTVVGSVEKFTEGSFNIPFSVVNLPKGRELRMLSKTVEVVFVIGLSNFNKIDVNSFKIECDYSHSEKNNLDYLIPKLILKSPLIKSYKINPNKIDFLIQK